MNMKIIPCTVADEYIRGAGAIVGAAGSHNDVALALTFSPKWDGLAKLITWHDALGEASTLTAITEEMRSGDAYVVPIPAAPKRYSGDIKMTVKGTETENGLVAAIAMSAEATFKVLPSSFDEDALSQLDIPATVADQLLKDAEHTRAIAQSVRDDADAGKFNAKFTTDDYIAIGSEVVYNYLSYPEKYGGELEGSFVGAGVIDCSSDEDAQALAGKLFDDMFNTGAMPPHNVLFMVGGVPKWFYDAYYYMDSLELKKIEVGSSAQTIKTFAITENSITMYPGEIAIASGSDFFAEIEKVGINNCRFSICGTELDTIHEYYLDAIDDGAIIRLSGMSANSMWDGLHHTHCVEITKSGGLDIRYFTYDWEGSAAPCLMEGTPINMADGTLMAIEKLRSGDIVLSYDPVADRQVPAVVIDSYVTGYSRSFDTYSFSDGRYLTIFGQHSIYNKRSGTTKDIQKSTRDDQIVNIDGETVQWAGTRKVFIAGERKRRYNLITSNNLYFANGILLGHKPFSKLQHVLDSRISVSDEIRTVWQSDCDVYNRHSEFVYSPEFNKEMAECNQKRARSEHIIAVCKKRLADSDYKVQKYTEGLIGDDEWKESRDKRARWRKEINDNETVLTENRTRCREIIARYRGGLTERSMFEECCERDNALFEACKEYFGRKDK